MLSFSTHFFICNIGITVLLGGILAIRKITGKHLPVRMQYDLWFFLPLILSLPFLSLLPVPLRQMRFWDYFQKTDALFDAAAYSKTPGTAAPAAGNWINDFGVSVSRGNPSLLHYLFCGIWLAGMILMILFLIKSRIRLYRVEASARLVQDQTICILFEQCRQEVGLSKELPLYRTILLKSPVLVGFFRPRIYLPDHLLLNYNEKDLRYMLLHELQHCRHHDPLMKHALNLAKILYWFHPLVWFTAREMQNDCELACDSSVLQMLEKKHYIDYGNTLIDFAEKISLSPFSFVSGMGGSMSQIKKRILNIASYRPASKAAKRRGICILLMTAVFLLKSSALLPAYASTETAALSAEQAAASVDLSAYFEGFEGSFVLYDSNADIWQIYNKDMAGRRISPNSTYKIYSALMALEQHSIQPEDTQMTWNGVEYPIPAWNQDQTLTLALQSSVNWYFQTLDQRAGLTALKQFYTELNYGNHDLSGGADSFWLESSLKISPVEQVELLQKLYRNEFNFNDQNVRIVKDAMRLSQSKTGTLYGKTGTGNVNGQNVNGWFIGYAEADGNVYYFAANIQGAANANGAAASQITLDILQQKGIY